MVAHQFLKQVLNIDFIDVLKAWLQNCIKNYFPTKEGLLFMVDSQNGKSGEWPLGAGVESTHLIGEKFAIPPKEE